MSEAIIDWSAIVEALYRQLLCRPADDEGLSGKLEAIASGALSFDDLLRGFTESAEFAGNVPELLQRAGTFDLLGFTNDVSQFGEVWELVRLWVNEAVRERIVVDVGARGRERSNSYDLMRHFGWRGLLIEANPELLAPIRRDFADLPFDLVGCAVSDYTGRATLTLGINNDVSSLSADAAAGWGPSPGGVLVDVRRLPDILDEMRIPASFGLLSVDIEGEDVKVLNDLVATSGYRPQWVIIEASNDFETRTLNDVPFTDEVKDLYSLRAQTRANLVLGLRETATAAAARLHSSARLS